MSDSEKASSFLNKVKDMVNDHPDGHLFISVKGEEIVINMTKIDLENLVNMTSSLMRYCGIEYAKYLSDTQGCDVDLDHALRTLTEGTIMSIAEMDLQEDFEKLGEELL